MSRTPPNLAYLTIYNPSLRSTGPQNDDDEDAEEQAHILFYTSKERAVSRDRMLRQIGLAKALVSFSEMFDAQNPLDTVHSQTRRMIMVSPEPSFWIHACIELAKVPRATHEKGKGKGKDKAKDKEKDKEKDKAKDVSVYDYEDGSVHDGALKEDIMRGYEKFKLMHGSFTAILDALGQEALGLQLERFWTPWAWSWSLEDSQDFGQHLGIALHPHFKALLPALDNLQDDLPRDGLTTLLLSPTSIVPSTAYLQNDYPTSLPLYLASLIPPPRDPSIHSQDDDVLASSQATIKVTDIIKDQGGQIAGTTSSFLNNMQAMDVRKWNWGGVLNLGRSSAKSSPQESGTPNTAAGTAVASTAASSRRGSTDQPERTTDSSSRGDPTGEEGKKNGDDEGDAEEDQEGDKKSIVETTVDLNALDDAISSRVSPAPSVRERSEGGGSSSTLYVHEGTSSLSTSERNRDEARGNGVEEGEERAMRESDMITPTALPVFLRKTVHLQDGDDPLSTSQKKVYFLLKGRWMLVLIGSRTEVGESEVQEHLDYCSRKSEGFFVTVEEIIQEESIKSMTDSPLPSATKILQPLDVHIGSTGKYTLGSNNFRSKSGILHDTRALQHRDPEILEVFSRGQNPQYWHLARRTRSPLSSPSCITGSEESGSGIELGEPLEMYMEVYRKEASLSDVGNVMVGVVKNWKGVVEEVSGL